jgi:hypothetical protein
LARSIKGDRDLLSKQSREGDGKLDKIIQKKQFSKEDTAYVVDYVIKNLRYVNLNYKQQVIRNMLKNPGFTFSDAQKLHVEAQEETDRIELSKKQKGSQGGAAGEAKAIIAPPSWGMRKPPQTELS